MSTDQIDLNPGQLVTLEGFSGEYRLENKKIDVDDSKLVATFLRDVYSVTNDYVEMSPSGNFPQRTIDPNTDPIVRLIEANRFMTPDTHAIFVVPVRDSEQVRGTGIITSQDDTTYDFAGEGTYHTGGFLLDAIPEGGGGFISNITFTAAGPDIGDVSDLSSNDDLWRAGYQVMQVGDEIFYLKSVTALGGGVWQLNEMIRARVGTAQEAHSASDPIVIYRSDEIAGISLSYLIPGNNIYAKSLPLTDYGRVDADDVTAQALIPYEGGGYRPLPPVNLNTTNNAYAWLAGTDAELRWDYKNAIAISAAGIGLSDETYELAGPEGYFKLTFLNGVTVVRTETVLLNTFTYTQAMMTTDFGAEPASFNVEVVEILNGLTSDKDTATITRV
jgi:hypothetical protein